MAKKPTKRKPVEMEPADWQERHSPTVEVVVKTGIGGRTKVLTRRRKLDAAIWHADWMTPEREAAAERIMRGYWLWAGESTCRISDYGPPPPDGDPPPASSPEQAQEWQARIMTAYSEWSMETQRQRLSRVAVIERLIEGRTVICIARRHHRGNAWPTDNLVLCLDAYLDVWSKYRNISIDDLGRAAHPVRKKPSGQKETIRSD